MERNKSFQNRPILYLVSTPIGNLREVSKRTIEVLNSVDFVAADAKVVGFCSRLWTELL